MNYLISNRDLVKYFINWMDLKSLKTLCLVSKNVCKNVKTALFSFKYKGTKRFFWINTKKIQNTDDIDQFHRNTVRNLLDYDDREIYKVFGNLQRLFVYESHSKNLVLPNTLINLSIMNYNHPLPILPPRLKTLNLGHLFNHFITKDMVPATLEHVSIGTEYSHDITPLLSPGLKSLWFSSGYKLPIKYKVLPRNLEELYLPILSDKPLNYYDLPVHLKYLRMAGVDKIPVGSLSNNLTVLNIYRYSFELEIGTLPPTLKKLTMGNYPYDLKPNILPPSLKSLHMRNFKGKILPNSIPPSVKSLVTSGNICDHIVIPKTVTHLDLTWKLDEHITRQDFPSNIKILRVRMMGDRVIKKNQLPSVDELHISGVGSIEDGALDNTECKYLKLWGYRGVITDKTLPSSITRLMLGKNSILDMESFPPTLTYLMIHHDYEYELPPLTGINVSMSILRY